MRTFINIKTIVPILGILIVLYGGVFLFTHLGSDEKNIQPEHRVKMDETMFERDIMTTSTSILPDEVSSSKISNVELRNEEISSEREVMDMRISICEQYSKLNARHSREYCFYKLAKERNDLALCKEAEGSVYQLRCEVEILKIDDEVDCELEDITDKGYCYLYVADIENDINLCERAGDWKSNCIHREIEKLRKPYTIDDVNAIENWEIYQDKNYNFEFKYPATFKKDQLNKSLLGYNDIENNTPYLVMQGMRVYHITPTGESKDDICYNEYSGSPIPCSEDTIDTEIGVFILNKSFDDLKETLTLRAYLFEDVSGVNREGVSTMYSFEGDGSFYYYFPLKDSSTLVMTRKIQWIFDKVNPETPYKNGNYDEVLFERILSTLKFDIVN